ncbi:MAG: MCE family protein [Gemmatimonadetes bacterium]|nr:MCE family protein [Gemmatimonadota bacterium]
MKWERTDLTVGAVVMLGLLILGGSLFWLSPALQEKTYPLYTSFESIDGVAEQAPVYLQGYTIGRVAAIEPAIGESGMPIFHVRMDIESRLSKGDTLRLPVGTHAMLLPPTVIGAGKLLLKIGPWSESYLEPGDTVPGVRAPEVVAQVQDLATSMTTELMTTLETSRALMDTLARTTASANQAIVVTTRALPTLLQGLQAELVAAESLTVALRTHLGALAPVATASIDSVRGLLGDTRRIVQDATSLLNAREPEISGILANLDSTTMLLQHFMREVAERPWRLFTGVRPPAGLAPPAPTKASGPPETPERPRP